MSMTMTGTLRDMTMDELAEVYATGDDTTCAMVLAECKRRDKADAEQARRDAIRAEGAAWTFAKSRRAEGAGRGDRPTGAGTAAGIARGSLFSAPARRVACYASEELAEWFDLNGRMDLETYTRQKAAMARDAR